MGVGIEQPFDIDLLTEEIDELIATQKINCKANPERMTISSVHTLLSISESGIRHLTTELGEYFSPPYVKGETRLFNKSSIIQVARLLNYLHATHVQYAGLKKFLELNPYYLVEGVIENHLDQSISGAKYQPKRPDKKYKEKQEEMKSAIKQSIEDIYKLQNSLKSM